MRVFFLFKVNNESGTKIEKYLIHFPIFFSLQKYVKVLFVSFVGYYVELMSFFLVRFPFVYVKF